MLILLVAGLIAGGLAFGLLLPLYGMAWAFGAAVFGGAVGMIAAGAWRVARGAAARSATGQCSEAADGMEPRTPSTL